MNQCKRLSDCPAERLAQCRGEPVPPAGGVQFVGYPPVPEDRKLPPAGDVECAICLSLGDQCVTCEESEFKAWAEKHFASPDYSQTSAGVFIKDWMRHSFAAWQARSKVVTRLTAERDGLLEKLADTEECYRSAAQRTDLYGEELKSTSDELTKARELLLHMQKYSNKYPTSPIVEYKKQIAEVLGSQTANFIACKVDESCGQDAEAAKGVFNDPLYNAESDARNAAAMLEEVLEFYDDGVGRSAEEFKLMRKIGDWLGRSVPEIEHGADECAHSEANKIGCPECGKEFKA
jgi:hypothetical protein